MSKGRFGIHGGQYMPETLMNAVIELEKAYQYYKDDPDFQAGDYYTNFMQKRNNFVPAQGKKEGE